MLPRVAPFASQYTPTHEPSGTGPSPSKQANTWPGLTDPNHPPSAPSGLRAAIWRILRYVQYSFGNKRHNVTSLLSPFHQDAVKIYYITIFIIYNMVSIKRISYFFQSGIETLPKKALAMFSDQIWFLKFIFSGEVPDCTVYPGISQSFLFPHLLLPPLP